MNENLTKTKLAASATKSAASAESMWTGFYNSSTLQNQGHKKEQTTFTTIENGNITTGATISFDANGNLVTSTGGSINDQTNLAELNRDVTKSQVITKDTITGALNVSTTIDNRLISAAVGATLGGTDTGDAAWESLMNDQMKLGENSKITTTELLKLGNAASDLLVSAAGTVAAVTQIPGAKTAMEETIAAAINVPLAPLNFAFEPGSKIINRDGYTLTTTEHYAINGIGMTEKNVDERMVNYGTNDVTVRLNPTHRYLADAIETGLDKTIGSWLPITSAMARLGAEDLNARGGVGRDQIGITNDGVPIFSNPNNVGYSQGSVILENAGKLYVDTYQKPMLTIDPATGAAVPLLQYDRESGLSKPVMTGQINPGQSFVAVGPAVGKEGWEDAVNLLGQRDQKPGYEQNPYDPIRNITAPTGLKDFFTGFGNIFAGGLKDHDITHPEYSKYLESSDPNFLQKLENRNAEGAR